MSFHLTRNVVKKYDPAVVPRHQFLHQEARVRQPSLCDMKKTHKVIFVYYGASAHTPNTDPLLFGQFYRFITFRHV